MNHAFVNSDKSQFDSNCSVCAGKDRDSVHRLTATVYTRDNWPALIQAMHSGERIEIDEEVFDYWLGVLPPVHMCRVITLPDGEKVRALFEFAEGYEPLTAFWREGERCFCQRTGEMNRW